MTQASHTKARTSTRALFVIVLAVSMLATSLAQLAFASPNVRVDVRVLLMTGDDQEEEYKAWVSILDRAGMPFDTFLTTAEPALTPDRLSGGVDHAKYQAVILTTGSLVICLPGGSCLDTFAPSEWQVLDDYQTRFGIRRISGNTYPSPAHGLQFPAFSGTITGDRTNLTTAGLAEFTALAGPVDIGVGTFGWYAQPDPAATFTTLLSGSSSWPGTSLVGVYNRPDGLEELVVTMAMGPSSLQTLLLGRGMLNWVTRGVYLGYERAYFGIDIDDVFLPNDRWDVDDNVTYEDDCATNPCIRMTPADVTRARNWQNTTGLTMTMAFNGSGSEEQRDLNGGVDLLADELLAHQAEFRWLNHTWTHEEFDSLTLPPLTQKQMIEEVRFNTNWAKLNGIPINPKELTTGSHSGLRLPDMAGVLTATGVEYIGADNSRDPEPFTIGGTLTLPRHPSNVYYNVGTLAEELDEYNYIFYENCTNTATTTCFSAPADQATWVDNEATVMLSHVLGNDPRPHYFHQANLAEEGTFYPVVDEVVARYNTYMAAPIVQQNYREATETILRATDWANAASTVDAYYQNGRIYLTSPTNVAAPLTGIPDGELYGGQRTLWANLEAGTTSVIDLGGFTWPMP